jgi:hypothetical protein
MPTKCADILSSRLYLQEKEVLLPIVVIRWECDVGRCGRLWLLPVNLSVLQLYSTVLHLVPQQMAVAIIALSVPQGGRRMEVKDFVSFTTSTHLLGSSDYTAGESNSSRLCCCETLQLLKVFLHLLRLPVRHGGIRVTFMSGLPNQCGSLRHHLDTG